MNAADHCIFNEVRDFTELALSERGMVFVTEAVFSQLKNFFFLNERFNIKDDVDFTGKNIAMFIILSGLRFKRAVSVLSLPMKSRQRLTCDIIDTSSSNASCVHDVTDIGC